MEEKATFAKPEISMGIASDGRRTTLRLLLPQVDDDGNVRSGDDDQGHDHNDEIGDGHRVVSTCDCPLQRVKEGEKKPGRDRKSC